MNLFREKITEMLEKIKRCYIERDKNNIGQLSAALFSEKYDLIIIGTSNGEWCFGTGAANELLLNDWEGWGNVSINMDSLSVYQSGDFGNFYVKAGVEYIFSDNDAGYLSFMDLISNIVKSDKPPLVKASEINWFLSHLLHTRNKGRRRYIWDLTITGIVQVIDGELKTRIMQFSIPVTFSYPDIRIDLEKEGYDSYNLEKDSINRYRSNHFTDSDKLVRLVSINLSKISKMKLSFEKQNYYIGFDGIKRNAAVFKEYLAILENKGNIFEDIENIIVSEQNTSFIFCGMGLMKREISAENEINNILNNIDFYRRQENTKDALFRLRRDLAYAFKESFVSNRLSAAIRFEGLGRLDGNSEVVFDYLLLSYPFHWILEQKTDAAVEVSLQ